MDSTPAFDFGENWAAFSANALTPGRIAAARDAFHALHAGIPLAGASFLDIGFGQGLSLLHAAAAGGRAVGCDINPRCLEVLLRNSPLVLPSGTPPPEAHVGSILDPVVVATLRRACPAGPAGYDVVHSWGVLHHTGEMWRAVETAAALVRPGGFLVLALYNRHWSSGAWLRIKQLYNRAPPLVRRLMVRAFVPVIYAAKWAVTRRNPLRQQRGMDFYYDVVDWIGGYPYEFCAPPEVGGHLRPAGFREIKRVPAEVPTGCNEFVFQRCAPGDKPDDSLP